MYYKSTLIISVGVLFLCTMHITQAKTIGAVTKQHTQRELLSEVAQVSIVSNHISSTAWRYDVLLEGERVDFNVYELLLSFKQELQIVTAVVPADDHCENRFIIVNATDQEKGTIRLACGTVGYKDNKSSLLASIYVNEPKQQSTGYSVASRLGCVFA